ncbi:hypothetical protein VTL71DRAFT_1210 [Oculimacula yallundae]|uniref:Kinesin motor domain-containing protein n=1 Tax=Oculimacula yallundae TaxID=86028 RepID=A0ABR4CBE3_9HELO
MESKTKASLFEVYLRLRPLPAGQPTSDRFLTVEETSEDAAPTHITLNPPNDNRRRAIEKFAFTEVFEEESTQLDLFQGTGVLPLVEGVLGPQGGEGRDALLATLGVTGSGKSHTILGSRTQRGLTQLALDVLFRSISNNILDPSTTTSLHATVAASDPSEAQVMSAQMFLDTMYNDPSAASRASSRAPTPMVVRAPSSIHEGSFHASSKDLYPSLQGIENTQTGSPKSIRVVTKSEPVSRMQTRSQARRYQSEFETPSVMGSFLPSYMQSTLAKAVKYVTKSPLKGESSYIPPTPRRNLLQRPSALPQHPDISKLTVNADPNAEYAILISMYEVYNDRIFDLLTPAIPGKSAKDFRRRPLLFKSTEQSPDRKVVAGLRKIICGSMKEALMVLEAGLHERRVAGTGSNSVSSRSHGFFCVEVKKRRRGRTVYQWGGSALTIVDLAGSERARDAKTQGATLAEAGKINESLMYLGQCLQMQSDLTSSAKPNLVPFRQCKLTELLFSNSFPSTHTTIPSNPSHSHNSYSHHSLPPRNPQKAVMIVTADPLGDFNATSQILRYSALAREITVPRIPSITSTILAQSTASHYFASSPRSPPSETDRTTMEIAALEIARMSEEIDGLREELVSANEARLEMDAHLESMAEKMVELEMEVREECVAEMEVQFQAEIARWKATWQAEQDRNDEHLDRKLEIYTRSIDAADVDTTPTPSFDDHQDDKENSHSGPGKISNLQIENERLRREIEILKREVSCKSLSKRMPLRESKVGRDRSHTPEGGLDADYDTGSEAGLEEALERMSVSSYGLGGVYSNGVGKGEKSPTKKVRKLVTRKWDLLDEGEML